LHLFFLSNILYRTIFPKIHIRKKLSGRYKRLVDDEYTSNSVFQIEWIENNFNETTNIIGFITYLYNVEYINDYIMIYMMI